MGKKSKVQSPKSKAQRPDIATSVMQEIGRKGVKMHSHWYFVLLSVLSAVALLATMVLGIYFVNFTVFTARHQAAFDYLGFGGRGVGRFLNVFPWGWLLLAFVSFGLLVLLLRRYDFAHKHHFYAVISGVVIGLAVLGAASTFIDLRPPGRPAQPGLAHHLKGSAGRLGGKVVAVDGDSLQLETPSGEVVSVDTQGVRLRRGKLEPGQPVLVLGRWQGNEFKAEAFRPAPPPPRRF